MKANMDTFEELEQKSKDGTPIPLQKWTDAAGLNYDRLIKDLAEPVPTFAVNTMINAG